MTQWFRRSLKRKITILLLVSILVPLVSLGLFSYWIASDLTEQKTKQSGMSILEQMGTNLEFIMKDMENMSIFLIGNKDVQKYLSSSKDEALKQQTRMIEFLTNLVYSKPYISDITIYPNNEVSPVSNVTIFESDLTDPSGGPIDASSKSTTAWWSPLYNIRTAGGDKRVVSFVRPVRSLSGYRPIGQLVISLDESVVASMLHSSGMPTDGYVLLLDRDNSVLSGSLDPLPRKLSEVLPNLAAMTGTSGSLQGNDGKNQMSVLFLTMPKVGWKLLEAIPSATYKSQNRYVLALTAIAVGVALLLIIVLVIFFVQRLTRPLRTLTDFLKNSDPEQPMKTYPVESMDEVSQLIRSYNRLSGRIERLTEQVKHAEAERTHTDMIALQAQINPHFLYNTLSSVHWMALMNQDHNTAEMVGSLTEFLRFSLNKGAQYCTVEQEFAHARHYANIQAIRYPDQLEMMFMMDPHLRGTMMVKLLLQPLIENALIHGIQKKSGKGVISVLASQQGAEMTFAIEDSGIGIEPERLMRLVSLLNEPDAPHRDRSPEESYGLRNVHRRLLLHYGADAGLKIESTPGVGTRISFTLPMTEE